MKPDHCQISSRACKPVARGSVQAPVSVKLTKGPTQEQCLTLCCVDCFPLVPPDLTEDLQLVYLPTGRGYNRVVSITTTPYIVDAKAHGRDACGLGQTFAHVSAGQLYVVTALLLLISQGQLQKRASSFRKCLIRMCAGADQLVCTCVWQVF